METARCQPLSFMGACVPVEHGQDVTNTGYSGYPALGVNFKCKLELKLNVD